MESTLPWEDREKRKGRHPASWLPTILYGLLALTVFGIVSFAIFKPILVLPRITLGPGFMLHNAQGEAVSNESYRGGITLYSFSYLACEAENCSQSLSDIQAAYRVMAGLDDVELPLAIATISLRPESDTPAALANRMSTWPAETSRLRWDYLTGEEIRIRHLVGGGFEIFFQDETDKVRFQPRYVLVDPQGLIRAYYHEAQIDPDILARDIRLLQEEATSSQGLSRIGYEAAHLFVCYP